MTLVNLYVQDVVKVSGEDARKLLDDTLTCRFEDGLVGNGRWFALLSPQGKVLIEGLVTETDAAFYFTIEAGLVADFVRRMRMYRLRAKVEIEHLQTHAVLWSPDNEEPSRGSFIAFKDERSPLLGTRYIIDWADTDATGIPAADPIEVYAARRIAAGVAEFGSDFGANEVFPHDIGMDLLQGVDFKKGCYVGQEVVSRMQHRGTARRRPVIVSASGAAQGVAVMAAGREAGTLGGVVVETGVAILRLDRIADPAAVTVGEAPATVTLPVWATYGFGEPAVD